MSKKKKILMGFFVGFGIMFVTVVVIIIAFVYFFIIGGKPKTTSDIQKYEEIFEEMGLRTGYMVFPEKIPEGVEQVTFYHSYQDTLFSPTVETYLQCTYDTKTYQKEVERLENTSKTYSNEKKELLRDEDQQYSYPAYIAVDNNAHTYEYALLTAQNQITYIFTMYGKKNSVHFDPSYLPKNYMEEIPVYGGYSIYIISTEGGITETDYTRNPVGEVHGTHCRMLQDDSFYVYYTKDSNGCEIIDKCSYWITKEELTEDSEIEYHDLDGCEYVDMQISEDYDRIIITYLQEGVEKTKEFQNPTMK